MFINCPRDPRRGVALTDDAGRAQSRWLADGVEVEIVAWLPRGGGGTRYRVRSATEHADGWVGPSDLRYVPEPDPSAPEGPAPHLPLRPNVAPPESGRKFGQRR
jgi:hypothetical protein